MTSSICSTTLPTSDPGLPIRPKSCVHLKRTFQPPAVRLPPARSCLELSGAGLLDMRLPNPMRDANLFWTNVRCRTYGNNQRMIENFAFTRAKSTTIGAGMRVSGACNRKRRMQWPATRPRPATRRSATARRRRTHYSNSTGALAICTGSKRRRSRRSSQRTGRYIKRNLMKQSDGARPVRDDGRDLSTRTRSASRHPNEA